MIRIKELSNKISWREVAVWGIVVGLLTLFLSLSDFLKVLNERVVIPDSLSLSNLVLLLPTFIVPFGIALRSRIQGAIDWTSFITGMLITIVASIPLIFLFILSHIANELVGNVLPSADSIWSGIVSFGNAGDVVLGSISLLLSFVVAGFLGSVLPFAQSLKIRRMGAFAGIVILYAGLMGMIASFNEREVIRDFITLGQLLIIFPPLIASYLVTRQLREEDIHPIAIIGSGITVGFLAIVPTIIILILNQASDDSIRNILTNINRDWVEIITFDNRNDLLLGSLLLLGTVGFAGLMGTIIRFIPDKIRRALIYGTALTLLIGTFGKTVTLILQEHLPRETLDTLMRRETLLQTPALILFGLGVGGSLLGMTFRQRSEDFVGNMAPRQRNVFRTSLFVLFVGFLILLPLLIGRALSDVAVIVGLYVMMGLGLNIAIGLAGLLDLGYVTNYAVGAYIGAVLTSTGPQGIGKVIMESLNSMGITFLGDNFSFWAIVPIALLAAMFAGFIFAVPVLKMRGDYLAIATLGFGEIIGTLAISDWLKPVIGGAQGVLFVPNPNFFGTDLKDPEQLYYVVLVACLVTLFVSIRLNNSRTGRQWMAIREDEDVATAMGIDTARAKLLAFTVSAATGGVAGAIFAAKVGTVFPNSFTVFVSINVLSLIIVGGMGSNPGIVLGAIVLVGMPELLREFSDYRWLLYGILLIVMMIKRPEGLIPSQIRAREMQQQRRRPIGAGD